MIKRLIMQKIFYVTKHIFKCFDLKGGEITNFEN